MWASTGHSNIKRTLATGYKMWQLFFLSDPILLKESGWRTHEDKRTKHFPRDDNKGHEGRS